MGNNSAYKIKEEKERNLSKKTFNYFDNYFNLVDREMEYLKQTIVKVFFDETIYNSSISGTEILVKWQTSFSELLLLPRKNINSTLSEERCFYKNNNFINKNSMSVQELINKIAEVVSNNKDSFKLEGYYDTSKQILLNNEDKSSETSNKKKSESSYNWIRDFGINNSIIKIRFILIKKLVSNLMNGKLINNKEHMCYYILKLKEHEKDYILENINKADIEFNKKNTIEETKRLITNIVNEDIASKKNIFYVLLKLISNIISEYFENKVHSILREKQNINNEILFLNKNTNFNENDLNDKKSNNNKYFKTKFEDLYSLIKETIFHVSLKLSQSLICFYGLNKSSLNNLKEDIAFKIRSILIKSNLYSVIFNLKSEILKDKINVFKCNMYILYGIKPENLALNPYFSLNKKLKFNLINKLRRFSQLSISNIAEKIKSVKNNLENEDTSKNSNDSNNDKNSIKEDIEEDENEVLCVNNSLLKRLSEEELGVINSFNKESLGKLEFIDDNKIVSTDKNRDPMDNYIINLIANREIEKHVKSQELKEHELSKDGNNKNYDKINHHVYDVHEDNLSVPFENSINFLKENYKKCRLLDKLELLCNVREGVNNEIKEFWNCCTIIPCIEKAIRKKLFFDGDNTLMLFTYIVIKSKINQIYVDFNLINDFISDKLRLSREGYFLTLILSSVEIINNCLNESILSKNNDIYMEMFDKEKEYIDSINFNDY